MTPRLYLYTDSPEPSGLGVHMLTLAVELQHRYAVAIVCPRGEASSELMQRCQQAGLTALLAPATDDGGARLTAWLAAQQIDVFHAHAGIGWEGHLAIRCARAAGVPVVLRTEHLPYLLRDPDQQVEHERLMALVDKLIVVSDASRASFLSAGVPAPKLRLVRNGIADSRAPDPGGVRELVRRGLGLSSETRLVLTVARLTPQKDPLTLVGAVPRVLAAYPDTHFAWVGAGPLRIALEAQCRRLGVTGSLQVLGSRRDVPQLLIAADLFVLPSLFEGLPLALLEAMQAAVPVIGMDVCGTAETIEDGVTGRLVPPGNSDALANAICHAFEHPELARALGRAAQVRVKRDFNAARMAAQTASVYEEALASRLTSSHTSERGSGGHNGHIQWSIKV